MTKIEGDPLERGGLRAEITPELKYSWGRFSCSFMFCLLCWISVVLISSDKVTL